MNRRIALAALVVVCLASGCNTENQAKETPVPPAAKTAPQRLPRLRKLPQCPKRPHPPSTSVRWP